MGVLYTFTCDSCGKAGRGTPGMYIHPSPPLGWVWAFGPGLDTPHACSEECWLRVCQTPDGRLHIPERHSDPDREPPMVARPVAPPPQVTWRATPKEALVYFARMGSTGPVKIGQSKDPRGRILSLQTSLPEALTLLGTEKGGRAREREFHSRFSQLRISGEWFRPEPSLMTYIRDNATEMP